MKMHLLTPKSCTVTFAFPPSAVARTTRATHASFRHCPRRRMRRRFLPFAAFVALAAKCFAPPPLVTGDVPTADKNAFEWYVGSLYQKSDSGHPSRLLPTTELVYGLT